MSEQVTRENTSIQDLEKEKLQAEIDILKARLATEFPQPEEKTPGWFEKVSAHVKGWSAFLLGAVTLISAIWGVILPLSDYLVERRKALEYELNENMISFVEDLNSEDESKANRGVMMLSYYEINSIPILLFFLETSKNEQEAFREKITETISLIYEDARDELIMEQILNKMDGAFSEIIIYYEENDKTIDGVKRRMLLNYMDLITKMNLKMKDREVVEDLYRNFKTTICQHPTLDEYEVFGIFSQICIYLNEEISCE